jgi:hypothetical protein
LGQTAAQVSQALRDGNPSIWVSTRDSALDVTVTQLDEAEARYVAEQLRAALLHR